MIVTNVSAPIVHEITGELPSALEFDEYGQITNLSEAIKTALSVTSTTRFGSNSGSNSGSGSGGQNDCGCGGCGCGIF